MFPFGFTVTVNRPGGEGPFGNPIPGPPPFDIDGCAGAPKGSVETVNGAATVLTEDTLYAPYDADVKPQDTITIPTGTPLLPGEYEVQGQPARWSSPYTGRKAGAVIALTRAEG